MVIVAFKPGEKEISKYEELDQYDYGQILRIQGLNLPQAVEIHFALQKTGGTSKNRIGITKDGVTDVPIPDSMLENEDTTQDYSIYAFIYLTDETSGQTEYRITMRVKARPKPEIPGGGDNPDIFHEAVEAVRESMEAAAESEKQAEGWAHGREDLPERAQDNAKYYSEQAREDSKKTYADRKEVERLVESVSGIDEQVTKVEKLTKQAQTSATNSALSEQAAKESENNAAQAMAGAEVAEDNAELAAQKVEQDKAIVEQAKNIVKQMGQEVLDNKNLVDETAQDFDLKAQQALADVNNAGQTQTERVQTAGNDAVESIKAAQGTATEAVETAKSEAIQAVQTEGTTQAGNVSAEGEKQVQAVQSAAQEIMADREQIQENKTGIAKLKEDLSEITEEYSKDITGEIEWINGKWHAASTIQDENGHKGAYVPVNAGEKYTITGDLFNFQDLYGLYDSDKNRVSYYPSPYSQHIPFVKMSATITIPSGVAYIFVSTVVRNSDGMGLVEDFSLLKHGLIRAEAEGIANEAKTIATEAKTIATEAVPKVVKYPNLLDWTTSEVGQLNNRGVLNPAGTTLTTTDYIPVEAGKNIYQSRAGAKYVYVYNPVAFYDNNKQFISPVVYGGDEYVTVPSNAKYMRVSVLNTNISMGVQMEYDRITEYHQAGSYNIIEKIENDIQSKSSISDVGFENNIIHERIIDSQLKNDFSWGNIDGLYATITFDDTNIDIDILEDLAEELNIPFCFATVPSYLSRTMSKGTETALQTLKRAVENGGEVLAHWQSPLTSASQENDYYDVYAGAKRTLEEAEFKVNGIITAGGYDNGLEFKTQDFNKSTRYGRIYYQYGDLTAFNNHNVEQFFNERIFTDSGVANMKSKIDAMATQGHGWLNMASHGTPTGNASNKLTISDFREIFQYAKDRGFTFVTWNTMYEKFKSSKLEKRVKALELN